MRKPAGGTVTTMLCARQILGNSSFRSSRCKEKKNKRGRSKARDIVEPIMTFLGGGFFFAEIVALLLIKLRVGGGAYLLKLCHWPLLLLF